MADGKMPPILRTSARTGEGIEELSEALLELAPDAHRGRNADAERVREEIMTLLERELRRRVRRLWGGNGALERAVGDVLAGREDPYSVAERMIAGLPGTVPEPENQDP